jgi:hypothetical protein
VLEGQARDECQEANGLRMDDQKADRAGGGRVAVTWRLRLAVVALLAVAVSRVLWQRRDRISEYMYFRNHTDETVWANDYSEVEFQKVHKGMTRLKVVELLGTPLESKDEIYCRCGTVATQSWTRGKGSGAYRRRSIYYVDDVVALKLSGVIEPTPK